MHRLYVVVAVVSFLVATPGMLASIRKSWTTVCPCCGKLVAAWRRSVVIATVIVYWIARSVLWFIAIPLEFLWLMRKILKEVIE